MDVRSTVSLEPLIKACNDSHSTCTLLPDFQAQGQLQAHTKDGVCCGGVNTVEPFMVDNNAYFVTFFIPLHYFILRTLERVSFFAHIFTHIL